MSMSSRQQLGWGLSYHRSFACQQIGACEHHLEGGLISSMLKYCLVYCCVVLCRVVLCCAVCCARRHWIQVAVKSIGWRPAETHAATRWFLQGKLERFQVSSVKCCKFMTSLTSVQQGSIYSTCVAASFLCTTQVSA